MHHVHLLMSEEVAMPDVLPSKVDQVIEYCNRLSSRILETTGWRSQGIAQWRRRVDETGAVGNLERLIGRRGPQCDDGILQRIHSEGFLPAQLIEIRHPEGIVPGNPVDQLSIEQMDVHGMGVHAVMRDLPDLGAISSNANRCPIN